MVRLAAGGVANLLLWTLLASYECRAGPGLEAFVCLPRFVSCEASRTRSPPTGRELLAESFFLLRKLDPFTLFSFSHPAQAN